MSDEKKEPTQFTSMREFLESDFDQRFKDPFIKRLKALKESKAGCLDYDEIMEELDSMNIPIAVEMSSDDDIELNCQIIDIIQAYRDRLTQIYIDAERDFGIIEMNYTSMYKMWVGVCSRLSSDKKREGEAEMLLAPYNEEREKRKQLALAVKNHMKNMSDKFFSISRKAAIHEHVYKLVGTGYIEQPDAFDNALRKRRPEMNKKMNALREKIASGATGWDAVPGKDEI